jgi:predicted nucleic acid-binding protein
MGLLIDSTILVRAERRRQTPTELVEELVSHWGDAELALSVMSAGELFHSCWRADTPARRARREEFVNAVLAAIPAVPVTLEVMRVYAQVDAQLSSAGARIPTSDLLIAATALCRGDQVVTDDPRHFDRVPGLTVLRLE